MEQLVILVVIGLISLVNWLLQKASEKRELAEMKRKAAEEPASGRRNVYTEDGPAQPRPLRRPAQPTPDPMRELMEALGLPADAAQPGPVARRLVPPPVVVEVEEEFSSLEDDPPALPQPDRRPPPDAKTLQLARDLAAAEAASEHAPLDARGFRALLASRSTQRQAVILAEIFGPPRGLVSRELEMGRS
jgi:hypothetical protein